MPRLALPLLILACSTALAHAESAADKALDQCRYARDKQAAMASCTSLIQDGSQPADVRARALLGRSELYLDQVRASDNPDQDDATTLALRKLPLNDLAQAIQLAPGNPDLYIARARIYRQASKYDDAIADLTTVLKADPKNAEALEARAQTFDLRNDYKAAIADLTALIDVDPSKPWPYSLRSGVWEEMGDGDKAAADRKQYETLKAAADLLRIRPDNFSIEPIDAAKSTYYVVHPKAAARAEPKRDAPADVLLNDGARVTVTGRTRNSYTAAARWFVLDYADRKPRYVLGEDLLDESSWKDRQDWTREARSFPDSLDKAQQSQGPLAPFMGAYFAGDTCPTSADVARASSQQILFITALQMNVLWSDGRYLYIANPARHVVAQLTPTSPARVSLKLGDVITYQMGQVSPPGDPNPDYATIGFAADASRVFFNFRKTTGNSYAFSRATKCDIAAFRDVARDLIQKTLAGIQVR